MNGPIEELYFNWLCAKVLDSNFEIHILMEILYKTEFIWVVQADANRAEDGLELRIDFLIETNIEPDDTWENEPCSLLEVLIAFAKRAQFQTEIPVKKCFWMFMANLGLDDFRNQSEIRIPAVEHLLQRLMLRQYDHRGIGGMFPLPRTKNDQREIELWYQFCEWVEYQGLI